MLNFLLAFSIGALPVILLWLAFDGLTRRFLGSRLIWRALTRALTRR